jgi:4-amino-4-deoxy-L-arabinose transferase-like glycosyltransferase
VTAPHARQTTPRALGLALELVALAAILALAVVLRLTHVTENPAWYTDEATHIDIARHLLAGDLRYMAVQDSTLLFARPPLFHLLLAALLRAAGPSADAMSVLRSLTGALGGLSVVLVYLAVRLNQRGPLALLAAFALAIQPQAVLYARFGFSYNLLAPLVLVALVGLTGYQRRREPVWLALAAVALGLATISEIAGFSFIVPFVLLVLAARRPQALVWSLPLLAAPFILYTLVMLARAPDAFLFDLRFTLGRIGSGGPLDAQLAVLANNYQVLLTESPWFGLGLVGLFLLRPARLRLAALLLFGLPLALIGRSFALYSLSAYYLIPFLPLLALGAAGLVDAALRGLWLALAGVLRGWRLAPWATSLAASSANAFLLVLLMGTPVSQIVRLELQEIQTGFPTAIDEFLIDTADARRVADFINGASSPDDIVIVSPVVGWLLHTNSADFQMTAAATGRATPHLPADIAPQRWAFAMDYRAARYVIVDNLWTNWGIIHVPGLEAILHAVETWPRVFEAGALRVYANPALNP